MAKKGLPLVSCLMATHGRYTEVCRSVLDFTRQDYPNRELIILNNHPEPLRCDLPGVRIINEPGHATLGDCRNRLLAEAQGEYVRTWDDDDHYLPWTISQGVAHIGDEVAFKPRCSWFDAEGEGFRLEDNVFEAAMLVRRDFAREHPYQPTAGDEHHTLVQAIHAVGGERRRDLGVWASYCYRWGYGVHHISGTMGKDTAEQRTADWMAANQDTGEEWGGELVLDGAMMELAHLFRRMAPYAGHYRHEFYSRCAHEAPPQSYPNTVAAEIHNTITRPIAQRGRFAALEIGRDLQGSTRQLLDNSSVSALYSVDDTDDTTGSYFEAMMIFAPSKRDRLKMFADLGDCPACSIPERPKYLTLNTGCAMANLQQLLQAISLLAPDHAISCKEQDAYLVRTVLEPTHTTQQIGDYLAFNGRVIPEWLHWPPNVAARREEVEV